VKNLLVHCIGVYLLSFTTAFCQVDNVGSGRAIRFDGIDDFIDLGDSYHNVNLPFSVSAWIYIDPTVNFPVPIFVSNDNDPAYRGFWFFISQNMIWCEFGDGTGGSTPAFRRGKQAGVSNVLGRWINVCAVMKAPFDINLFVNGINVGGNSMGNSNLPMASSFPGDHPKIGYFLSNNVTYRFKGIIDEVRLWSRALTEKEVRDGMCTSLVGNETGLIGYWDFNEISGGTMIDKSATGQNGILAGNPSRVFSGAPVGANSVNEYRNTWTDFSIEIAEGEDKLVVSNVKNIPEGIHLYKVSSKPSQTEGLDASALNLPYFGVFVASLDTDNKFDVSFLFQNKPLCKSYVREDNSVATWATNEIPLKDKLQRGEFVKAEGNAIMLDLGSDVIACNTTEVALETKISDPQVSFLWSTGQTTSEIIVNQPGKYWVRTENLCGISSDTIRVNQITTPPAFSFGDDMMLCDFGPVVLKPYANSVGYQFTWQDNSTADSFTVEEFGTYSVTVKNMCGEATDMITFSPTMYELSDLPNVITPNGDLHNEYFEVGDDVTDFGEITLMIFNRWGKQVYYSESYKNDWNGSDLTNGIYFYELGGKCIKKAKGSLSIVR